MDNNPIAAIKFAQELALIKSDTFMFLSAEELCKKPYLDCINIIISPLSAQNAASVKKYLLEFYPPLSAVTIYDDKIIKETTLEYLDNLNNLNKPEGDRFENTVCSLFVKGDLSFNKDRYTLGDLLRIIKRLTAEDGCPWDKVQTHESIRQNMIEEAYEAVNAINNADKENIIEELGDVLLQTVLHSDIAERGGDFTFGSVISVLCEKLYRRHTHVFGDDRAAGAGDALNFWEKAKTQEKQNAPKKSVYNSVNSSSGSLSIGVLEGVSSGVSKNVFTQEAVFPALLSAQKRFKKILKEREFSISEAIKNLNAAIINLTQEDKRTEHNALDNKVLEDAAGDFLFAAMALCTLIGIDSEIALSRYCAKL